MPTQPIDLGNDPDGDLDGYDGAIDFGPPQRGDYVRICHRSPRNPRTGEVHVIDRTGIVIRTLSDGTARIAPTARDVVHSQRYPIGWVTVLERRGVADLYS